MESFVIQENKDVLKTRQECLIQPFQLDTAIQSNLTKTLIISKPMIKS